MKRLALIAVTPILALSLLAAPSAYAQPGQGQGLTVPVTGSGPGGAFAGSFIVKRFVASDGSLTAVGTLSGTLTTTAGQVTSVLRNIALPVAIGATTCEILHLDLGPLSIDLLGLQIDLSRIVLDITAQSGAGNLLGNLLCGVANLLNDPSGLARLLNSILDILT